MSNFSFSHSVFYPFRELSAIFIKFEIVVFKLFQLDQSEIMWFWKGIIVKSHVYDFTADGARLVHGIR